MKIGSWDSEKSVFVIAEIGNCHEGSVELAEELIGHAARAGANAVKFQTIVPEKLVSLQETERIKQLKRLCLTYPDFERLKKTADRENILFLSTPFDLESVDFLDPIMPAFKVASGDNHFWPLIESVAKKKKPLILSSGMLSLDETKKAAEFIKKIWRREKADPGLAILHCVVSYPAPAEEANLRAIESLKSLSVTPGYSDHTIGINAAVLSVALGARIVEKHFTIDNNYSDFRDHKLAANPKDLKEMVDRIREAETLMGDGVKRLMDCEKENKIKVRRSVSASRDLKKGEKIRKETLSWVRPGTGVPPGSEGLVLGKKLRRDLRQGDTVLIQDLEDGTEK